MHNRPFGRRTAGRQRESREADAPWPQGWLPERHIATLATFLLTAQKLPLEVFKLVLDIGPFAAPQDRLGITFCETMVSTISSELTFEVFMSGMLLGNLLAEPGLTPLEAALSSRLASEQ